MKAADRVAPALAEGEGRRTFPCSQSQKRFWFESQLHPDNPALNVAVRWRLEGEVSQAQLEEAWRIILGRHQTLRTFFAVAEGEPHQIVEPSVPFRIPVVDLTTLGEAEAIAEADRVASLEAQRTFDITSAPLIRVTLVRIRPAVSMVLVTAHHAVCDGWSVGILAHEMGEICAAQSARRPPVLPTLDVTYADYAAWEREWLSSSPTLPAQRAELAERLKNFTHFEVLPDKPRPAEQAQHGEIVSMLLDRRLTGELADLARANNCTLFMAAYASLLVLLHRYTGENDIVIGTQIAGREEVDFEHLVGTFINTVALRTDMSGDPTFRQLLARACDTVTDALELRNVPLEELVEILNPKRDLSRNGLFSVNFVYQRSFIQNETYGRFKLVDQPSRSAGPICDLNFFMVERPEGWRVSCEFNADLYRRRTVELMLDRYVALLNAVAQSPAAPISTLPLMDAREREAVLALGPAVTGAYDRQATVHRLFERQAALTPAALAAVDPNRGITYAELDVRANRIAHYLRTFGVGPGTTVGVALERSLDVPAVLLAVLKAGAAYVPLDPSFPRERLAFILRDAAVSLIVTNETLRNRLPRVLPAVLDLDESAAQIAAQAPEAPLAVSGPESLAYIMYTSGSTGRPKGVEITHRGIVRLVFGTNYISIGPSDVVLQAAPLAFDASTFEVWAPLLNGGRLAFAKPGALSIADLQTALDSYGVSVLWLTAPLFREFVEAKPQGLGRLRTLLAGGDVISPLHAKRFVEAFPQCALINGYGPTENTTFSCTYRVPSADAIGDSVPIGYPIAGSSAYVLDAHLEPVPFGVVGELCVGGDGLARGYVNLPEATAQRFVRDPFDSDPGARLYRTGDRVRQREDGVIEFVGRGDDQVKIRGFRIELHEIEAALCGHPNVSGAAAIVRATANGDKTIRAYVVPRNGPPDELDLDALHVWLSEILPTFMLPSTLVALAALPLNANGKVDRSALPEPPRRAAAPAKYRTATEARVAEIIGELLGIKDVERDRDFFSLGFHSLLAVRFAARVQSEFGVDLKLRALFEHPTVADIAARIEESPTGGEIAATPTPIARLNSNGTRPPLIYFHGDLFAEGLYSRRLAAALGSNQPVYAVAPHGTAGLPLLGTVEEMARNYADLIRTVQPNGPYRLSGFCASGLIAYEVARILRSQGEVVERLILTNSAPMPTKRINAFDDLVRRFGLNSRLKPRLRDRLCYNIARLHAGAVAGPFAFMSTAARILRSLVVRSQPSAAALEPEPFEKRRGARETENSFTHIVAAFTYHPEPYDGEVTLLWAVDQETMLNDWTMGWGVLAKHVEVMSMSGGHIAALNERIEELADVMTGALRD